MLVFDLLRFLEPRLDPELCKVHLCVFNGITQPIEVFVEGRFDEDQLWQKQRNFQREFVISFIELPEAHAWLFAGTFQSHGCEKNKGVGYTYDMTAIPATDEFVGRLTARYVKPGRQNYPYGESVAPSMTLIGISPERAQIADFPGFKKVNLTFRQLDVIARQNLPTWRSALSASAGVYLISDARDGKLYVGSATGVGGIWARWCQYLNGHGENKRLQKLIKEGGVERAMDFHFSILEIADTHTGKEEILVRESHWKKVLMSRVHGHNAN